MFIPSFVLAIFIYSFFDIYFLRRSLKARFVKQDGKSYLQIIWKKKVYDSLFKLAFDDWEKIRFLSPKKDFSFEKVEWEWNYLLIVQWKIDIFRHVIDLWKVSILDNLQSIWKSHNKDIYFFSRPMEDGEWVDRIDYIRSAKGEDIFLKQDFRDKIEIEESWSKWKSWIKLLSSSKTSLIKSLRRWEYLEWLIILLWIIVIYLEWKNLSFLIISWWFAAFTFMLTMFLDKKINSKALMKLSFLALFVYFFIDWKTNIDWIAAWAHFLLLAAILKHLFKREFRDSFTYIFLILFVFVALSLLTLKSWFIIFFALFIFLTVNLFITYSWWDLKHEFSRYFVINRKWKTELVVTYFVVFIFTIFLFFILPHWDKEKQDMSTFRAQESDEVKTWFDEKVSLDNIRELKNDYSKAFVLENAEKNRVNEYKNTYWRWMRFWTFLDYHWNKLPQRDSNFRPSSLKWKDYEEWRVKYYLDASKNIFVPKIPLQISDRNIVKYWFDNSIFYYNKPQFSSRKVTFAFEKDNGRITEWESELKFIETWMDDKTQELLEKYWESIPEEYIENPWLLSKYVRDESWFLYSMEEPAKNLNSFLYSEKQWHCEYYATVLTLTLQNFWYKATFVNWFYGWEWNDVAKVWVVRWADAHSWVEVYNDEWKWDIYDPTPTARYEGFWFDDIEFMDDVIKYYDLIELKWYNYIVWFTWSEQKKIWSNIFKNYDKIIFLSLSILIIILTRNVFLTDIIPYFRRTKKERFMWRLKNKTKSKSFVLMDLAEKYPDLVNKTRELIFSKKDWDLTRLKKDWKKVLSE